MHIVQFYGACLQPGADPMLVCEFMEGASLPAVPQLLCLPSRTSPTAQARLAPVLFLHAVAATPASETAGRAATTPGCSVLHTA